MKHWVFDLDGTLVDSHHVYFNSLREVFGSFGADFSVEDEKEVLRISGKEREIYLARKVGRNAVQPAMNMFMARLQDDLKLVRPFAGVVSLLESLAAKGTQLAVWTARDLYSAKLVLEETGLGKYFSSIVSSNCISQCKPAPEGLMEIASRFQCDSKSLTMVGDHDNDIMAAKACGAKAIRVFWHDPKSAYECKLADWQFSEVATLAQWIESQSAFQAESASQSQSDSLRTLGPKPEATLQ